MLFVRTLTLLMLGLYPTKSISQLTGTSFYTGPMLTMTLLRFGIHLKVSKIEVIANGCKIVDTQPRSKENTCQSYIYWNICWLVLRVKCWATETSFVPAKETHQSALVVLRPDIITMPKCLSNWLAVKNVLLRCYLWEHSHCSCLGYIRPKVYHS